MNLEQWITTYTSRYKLNQAHGFCRFLSFWFNKLQNVWQWKAKIRMSLPQIFVLSSCKMFAYGRNRKIRITIVNKQDHHNQQANAKYLKYSCFFQERLITKTIFDARTKWKLITALYFSYQILHNITDSKPKQTKMHQNISLYLHNFRKAVDVKTNPLQSNSKVQ